MKRTALIEVGKKYRGLVNGCLFTIVKELKPIIKEDDNEYFLIRTENGKEFSHSRSYLEHLLIEEVK